MAKATEKNTKAKPESTKAKPKSTEAKEKPAENEDFAMSDEDLAALAMGAAEREQNARARNGMNATFISLCQHGSSALKKKEKTYIEGLEERMFFVQNKRLILGEELKVVPLAIIEVYNEMTDEKKPKFLGVWCQEDAEQYDLAAGDYYKRELPNGNMLHPCTWILCFLPDHPELERCVISFKSTARKVANVWRKDIDSRGGNPAALEYILTAGDDSNASGDWYKIEFEFNREIFKIEDGKFVPKVKYARDAVLLQESYTKAYAAGQIVRKRSSAAIAGKDQARLEASSDSYEGSDDPQEF